MLNVLRSLWASKMAQEIKGLVAEPDNLRSIARIRRMT